MMKSLSPKYITLTELMPCKLYVLYLLVLLNLLLSYLEYHYIGISIEEKLDIYFDKCTIVNFKPSLLKTIVIIVYVWDSTCYLL